MGLKGSAVATQEVVQTAGVTVNLTDAGEIRRLGRILVAAGANESGKTGSFARELASALGFNEENTRRI